MNEYPIGRAFRDSRVQTIYGGTSQIMKEIIGRDIAGRYPKDATR
jgi:long-chain-acyl-CoA dehydrogenase